MKIWEMTKLYNVAEILQGISYILQRNIANYCSCQFNNRLIHYGV